MNKNLKPKLWGGIGEKKSNSNTQWYQQNRIYDAEEIAMCHPANIPYGSYMYAVKEIWNDFLDKPLKPCEKERANNTI